MNKKIYIYRGFKKIKKSVREQVFERDGYKCLRCGSTKNLTIDHAVPLSRGGSKKIENLQTLCQECNCHKENNIIFYTHKLRM